MFETYRDMEEAQTESLCEERGRYWSNTSISQEISMIASNLQKLGERQGEDISSESPK